MRAVATVAEVRTAEAAAAVGEARLIERASCAVGTHAIALLGGVYGRRVVVLAGAGHNGADAIRAGALLARRGAEVLLVRTSDQPGDEHVVSATADLAAAGGRVVAELPAVADLVIDGMVGTGGRGGGLTGRAAELASELAGLAAVVVAVDIPSGVSADTGEADHTAVRADLTVTFGALKPGLVVGPGADLAGYVVVADIGLALGGSGGLGGPASLGLTDADDAAVLLPTPGATDDKYSRGVVGVLAGSAAYPGAALLCVGGAVRAGAGYVRVPGAGPEVLAAWPSAVAAAGRVDAWVVGPGLGPDSADAVRELVAGPLPLVLDAAGLDLAGAAALRGRTAPTLITPHAGELARLTGGEPGLDVIGLARAAAADLGVHVLLKGRRTVVAAPDGRVRINPTGSTWLSTAGTGDVLAGAAGALLAAAAKRGGADPLVVGAAVAFLHGLAGSFATQRGNSSAAIAADDLLGSWGAATASVRSTR